MGLCGPQDVDKSQILFREQSTEGTAETLTAADGKIRVITGTTPEYSPERNPREIARATLTPIGTIEGKKMLTLPFTSEINTPDTFNIAATAAMDVDDILFQSSMVIRYTMNGSPDLSDVVDGSYLTVNTAANASNNGTFLIITVSDGSDYVDVINKSRVDNTDDEASDCPAVADIQTNLEYQAVMNCCGMHVFGMTRQSIGAVTSGPFQHGETMTQDTSSATAKVIIPAVNGDSYIYYKVLTGLPTDAKEWTGGTSGATATASSGPLVHGYFVEPRSNCMAIGTGEYQEDGQYWQARDMMGNMTGSVQASQQGFMDFTMQGPRSDIDTKALTTGITRSTEEPPVCKNADLKFDDFEPVFSQIGWDLGNNVVMRANGNAADDTGYEGARIAGTRAGKFTATVEAVLAADFDFYTKLDAGTKIAVEGHIGTSESKRFWFFFPNVELDELPLGEIDKLRTFDITGTLTGLESTSGDDEYCFAFIGD